LQRALSHDNQAKEQRSYGRFKESDSKEKTAVNCVKDDALSDEDAGVCVVKWVDGQPVKGMWYHLQGSR
jgi:hypothetical protein